MGEAGSGGALVTGSAEGVDGAGDEGAGDGDALAGRDCDGAAVLGELLAVGVAVDSSSLSELEPHAVTTTATSAVMPRALRVLTPAPWHAHSQTSLR